MDVINAPHALQAHPVLKPHHPTLRFYRTDAFLCRECTNKVVLDKVFDHTLRFTRDVSSSVINCDRCSRPNADVLDAGCEPIRPIVWQDSIVHFILERDRRVMGERVCRDWLIRIFGSPGKAFLDDKIGDAAVCLFGLERPAKVLVQVRGQAFQLFEFVVCFEGTLVFEILMQRIRRPYR
jgi:hypothetical protein